MSEWISVAKQDPPVGFELLLSGFNVYGGRYFDVGNFMRDGSYIFHGQFADQRCSASVVTHWMLIPELHEEEA